MQMKQQRWFLLVSVLMISSIALEACSFTFQALPIPPPSESLSTASIPTSTQPSNLVQATETATPPAALLASETPTLISIRADTIPMLEVVDDFELKDIVRSLAFTRDGTVLAAAGGNDQDSSIQLWDVVNGKSLSELKGHAGIVWGVAFSPDGQLLASVSSDQTAKVWDWRSGTMLSSLNFPGQVVSVSFSPDGQTVAVGGVDEPQNQIQNASVWIFSVGSWKPLLKLPEYLNVTALAYSPDGRWMVGGGTSRNVQVWRASDGTSVFTLNHAHQVFKTAISPDSSTVATATCQTTVNDVCTEGGVWLWDLLTGKLAKRLGGFPDVVEDVAFSADGSTLIAASRDGTLRFYDTSTDQSIFEFTVAGGISAMSISPDGGFLVTGSVNGHVQLWKIVYHP
jgi:WD40 repeat protein